MNATVRKIGPGETLDERRLRLAREAKDLGRDELDDAARATDIALELIRGLATSAQQTPILREHSARVAAALGPYLRALDAAGRALDAAGRTAQDEKSPPRS